MRGNLKQLAPPFLQGYDGHLSEELTGRCVLSSRLLGTMHVCGQNYLHPFFPSTGQTMGPLFPHVPGDGPLSHFELYSCLSLIVL